MKVQCTELEKPNEEAGLGERRSLILSTKPRQGGTLVSGSVKLWSLRGLVLTSYSNLAKIVNLSVPQSFHLK